MGAHVALEIEVSKLLGGGDLEKGAERLVRVDLATILGILEIVSADVLVDLAGDLGAGHLGTKLLSKEGSKLVADLGRLNKTAGLTVSVLALLLCRKLLGGLKLAKGALLETTEIVLQRSDRTAELIKAAGELGKELGELSKGSSYSRGSFLNNCIGSSNNSLSYGSSNGLGGGALLGRGFLSNSGSGGGGGGSSDRG